MGGQNFTGLLNHPMAPPPAPPQRSAPALLNPGPVYQAPVHSAPALLNPAHVYQAPAHYSAPAAAAAPRQNFSGLLNHPSASAAPAPKSEGGGSVNVQALARARIAQQYLLHQVHDTWTKLLSQGLLSPTANFPGIQLNARDMFGGNRPYAIGSTVHFPAGFPMLLTYGRGAIKDWAQSALVHETAHTMQNKEALATVPMREGGAQAFADAANPKVNPGIVNYDSNYAPYVRSIQGLEPSQYIMRGQFAQDNPRQPPWPFNQPKGM